jgi:hypothetical protein
MLVVLQIVPDGANNQVNHNNQVQSVVPDNLKQESGSPKLEG